MSRLDAVRRPRRFPGAAGPPSAGFGAWLAAISASHRAAMEAREHGQRFKRALPITRFQACFYRLFFFAALFLWCFAFLGAAT